MNEEIFSTKGKRKENEKQKKSHWNWKCDCVRKHSSLYNMTTPPKVNSMDARFHRME